jgi:hypothetical protein
LQGSYKFVHDRIQEAAYSLIPEELHAQTYLLCRAALFRGNGAGSAAHYFVGSGTWGTG